MRNRLTAAALAAVVLLTCAPTAEAASNYTLLDGNGQRQTFCSLIVSAVEYPCQMLYGDYLGTPGAINVDSSYNIGVDIENAAVPLTVVQSPITWTQTSVTLSPGSSATLVTANSSRKALRWMVTGSNPMTVAPGSVTVTAGVGMNYSPGSGTGFQGGSEAFGPNEVSTQAFSAISTLGTTVTVWQGQ